MSDTQDTLIERLNRGALAYMSDSGPVYAGPTALEREAATALADRDAKIAELERERDYAVSEMKEARQYMRIETHHAEAAEAQVAELTQKLERATALVAKFVRCNDEGPGLIDCIDNDGERYTSQFLSDTVREARALNSGASPNG